MKKALLIGINAYPPGNQLTGCIEDICCLEKAIARNGDGSLNFEVKKLADVQSSGIVMEGIRQLFDGACDMALLYFSGHGCVNDTGAEIVMPDDIRDTAQYYNGIQMKDIMDIPDSLLTEHFWETTKMFNDAIDETREVMLIIQR